jgi:hypothetical protein
MRRLIWCLIVPLIAFGLACFCFYSSMLAGFEMTWGDDE